MGNGDFSPLMAAYDNLDAAVIRALLVAKQAEERKRQAINNLQKTLAHADAALAKLAKGG